MLLKMCRSGGPQASSYLLVPEAHQIKKNFLLITSRLKSGCSWDSGNCKQLGEGRGSRRGSHSVFEMGQSERGNEGPRAPGEGTPHNGRLLEISSTLERRMLPAGNAGIRDPGEESKLRELFPSRSMARRPDALADTLVPDSPVIIDFSEQRRRCDRLIAAGEAKSTSGDYKTAQDTLRKAAELADRLHDQDRLTRIAAALPGWHWPSPGQSNPLALLLAQRALAAEQENSCRRAILMARVAAELSYFPSQRRHSRELGAAAIDLAAGKDSPTELRVRLFRDPLLREPHCATERFQNAEQIIRLAVEAGDYAACFLGGLAQSAALSVGGNLTRAHQVADVTAEIASVSGSSLHKGIAIAWKTSRAIMEGRFAQAEEGFARCRILAAKNQNLFDACWPAMLLPLSEAGRLDEIEEQAEETVGRRPGAPVFQALLSLIKIRLGKSQDACFLLDRLAADDYLGLRDSDGGWVGVAALAEVCAGLDRPNDAAVLYELLLPHSECTTVLSGIASFGSMELHLGELALLMGRFVDAERHFEKSFAYNRRIGARPWAAYSHWGLARTLVACGAAASLARAVEVLDQLEGEADRMQMNILLSRIEALRMRIRASAPQAPRARAGADSHAEVQKKAGRRSAPARLHSAAAAPLASGPAAPAAEAQHGVVNFHRDGDIWELGFQGRTFWLRHCRGLDFMHFLLSHAGREFSAMEVVHQGRSLPDSSASGYQEQAAVHSSAAPILDAQAKQAYRERIRELAEDLEDARQSRDVERAERVQQEKEFVARELARALGLFDRDRKFNAEADRARKCVRMAISRAIASISRRDKEFGQLLVRSVRTGNSSSFVPRIENDLRWRL